MALNLVKLCVGCSAIEELAAWIDFKLDERRRAGLPAEQFHTTRMVPKRAEELLDGGSLYWVIKGNIQCRQQLTDIRTFTDDEGISRCHLVLDPRIIATEWQPRRAFQGWRYLTSEDAPFDEGHGKIGRAKLPPELRNELAALGLL
ncbi:DUF1489 family protein [Phyllobacterium endophyticum]|uniref:DUF1489 domain-containing protein n=1 Tax=Phyllobacterium endophyticum TaxID=1149773 RepID=A0A2P7AVB6_9HYPH|nr:DUF1489 family protein [Phyllobacterium endophyticum]MBB3234670.1 hypothetical protein [Phyllobacterium endophyticum]PSH58131.1 DUF1489 domain-containing protein [Phyllobacterium endophyticum]TYR38804.1 DUF1489 family protein [Phyllobacterium endophyticum]